MESSGETPHRKTIRLGGYNYSQAGAYFVTVCSYGDHCIFGSVVDGNVELTPIGQAVRSVWYALPDRFPRLVLDSFVLMPNHLHGIVGLVGEGLALPVGTTPTPEAGGASPSRTASNKSAGVRRDSLANVIGAFKSISTITVNRMLRRKGIKLWQRSYHDHIIRNGEDLRKIQQYILENPLMWEMDSKNPERKSK